LRGLKPPPPSVVRIRVARRFKPASLRCSNPRGSTLQTRLPPLFESAWLGPSNPPSPVVRIRLLWRFKRASLRCSRRVRGDGRKAEAAVQGSGVGVWGVGVLRRVQRVSSRWRGVSELAGAHGNAGFIVRGRGVVVEDRREPGVGAAVWRKWKLFGDGVYPTKVTAKARSSSNYLLGMD
jgi:hypothetical protein